MNNKAKSKDRVQKSKNFTKISLMWNSKVFVFIFTYKLLSYEENSFNFFSFWRVFFSPSNNFSRYWKSFPRNVIYFSFPLMRSSLMSRKSFRGVEEILLTIRCYLLVCLRTICDVKWGSKVHKWQSRKEGKLHEFVLYTWLFLELCANFLCQENES